MSDRPRPDGSDAAAGASPADESTSASPPRTIERSWATTLTRRDLLKGLGLGAVGVSAASLLEACSPAATAAPPPRPVPRPPRRVRRSWRAHPRAPRRVPARSRSASSRPRPARWRASRRATTSSSTDPGDRSRTPRASRSAARRTTSTSWSRTASPTRTARRRWPSELILQDKADLIVTTSTPETTNPVATVCEAQGVPCLSTVVPWQAWYFGRQARPGEARSRSSTRRCSSSASRRSAAASSRCGTASRTTRVVAGCSRTTPTATRSATAGRR